MAHETIDLTGDWSTTTNLEVFAPSSVSHVRFNGEEVRVSKTLYGSLMGKLGDASHLVSSIQAQLPPFKKWKVNDGLPERNLSYDDSRWVGKTIFVMPQKCSSIDSRSCKPHQHAQPDASRHIPSTLRRRIR
jgi:Beta-galactosidase, domain 3